MKEGGKERAEGRGCSQLFRHSVPPLHSCAFHLCCSPSQHMESPRCTGTICHQHPSGPRDNFWGHQHPPAPRGGGSGEISTCCSQMRTNCKTRGHQNFLYAAKPTSVWWQMWPELTWSSCSQLLKRLSIAAAAHTPGSKNLQMLLFFVLCKTKVGRFSMNREF